MGKIACWSCGAPADRALFIGMTYTEPEGKHARHFCMECYQKEVKQHQEQTAQYARLKKRLMLERAIRSMEAQGLNLYRYRDTITQLTEYIEENPEKFDSSEEMICAILFVDEEIKAIPQKKILRYRVDFYIPEYKIIIEVDGHLHRLKVKQDNQRDREIRQQLGADWEIIRIPTKYINTRATLLIDAVFSMKDEKQKIRRKNAGMIPEWFNGSI